MNNKKALITIFLIVFIDLLGFSIILPLLPFIAERFGAKPFTIGLLAASYSFFQLIAAPVLGRLSDRYGRKKILILSQIGSALGFILLGLAGSLPLLFLSRIIDGITGGNISIAQAYMADITDKKNRAKGMGMLGAAFGLGFIFGPAVGGLLSQFGFWVPAFFAASISIITAISTTLFLKETVNVKKASHSPKTKFSFKEIKKAFITYPVGMLIMVFLILNLAFSTMQGTFALWTEKSFGFGPTENGWLFTYIGILSVIIQLKVLPFLVKRVKEKNLLQVAVLLLSFGLFLIPILASPNLIFLALFFLPFGNGLANPTIQALASENVAKEDYGETLGILQSAGSLGRIFGPIIGGWLFQYLGKDSPYFMAASLVFACFIYIRTKLR